MIVTTCYVAAGGISKTDIRRFLYWAADDLGYSELRSIVAAPPSAELEPIREGEEAQTDEQDMGMTYDVSSLISTCTVDTWRQMSAHVCLCSCCS